ncbi:MAG: apolipoprotein N-acyltransferase [Deltaproteobacteria bacterium]|nr:MAG: apolipoprotein N-acyltransferase [Deltaproteobacteria bacterium]
MSVIVSKKARLHLSSAGMLSVISGLLLTASFPPLDLSFVSWFAVVPLLKAIEKQRHSQAFKLGLLAGTVHFLTLLYWIVIVLGRYGNLNVFLSVVTCFLLCFYLSLYIGGFSLLAACSRDSRFFAFWIAVFWVGLEYVRAHFLTGFPWCLFGYSQYAHLYLIQAADIFGVYGISFLIIFVNGVVYGLFFRQKKESCRSQRIFLTCETAMAVLMLFSTLLYGRIHLTSLKRKSGSPSVNIAVIQGNIDQAVKWNPAYQKKTFRTYEKLTRTTYDSRPDLIVWPETSVPGFFQDNTDLSKDVISLAKEAGCAFLFGSPAYRQTAGGVRYYNRAYLITAGGKKLLCYDKVHLVPFGEYVPFKKILAFVNRLVPAAGDFSEGAHITPLNAGRASLGVLICFEIIFPDIAGQYARQGANMLVNLTNDAWFGKSSAPYQHLAMAVFRAVETGKPLVRAANTGFSAIIDPGGRMIAKSGLFCEQTLTCRVHVSASEPTPYARYGDWFALSLLIMCLIKTFMIWRHVRSGVRFSEGTRHA